MSSASVKLRARSFDGRVPLSWSNVMPKAGSPAASAFMRSDSSTANAGSEVASAPRRSVRIVPNAGSLLGRERGHGRAARDTS